MAGIGSHRRRYMIYSFGYVDSTLVYRPQLPKGDAMDDGPSQVFPLYSANR